MHQHTLTELRLALHSKSISSAELTQHYLTRIQQLDPALNSFITVTSEQALTMARAADQQLFSGTATALTGIPLAQKDLFCTQGIKTSCASKMLDNFIAPYNATIVDQFNAAGMVLLGKTNMDEFAMGSSNENSFYGPVKNPWDLTRTPGGSSGGSAAAVAAGLCPVATGTDTGGSIRQPAAMCGITGIKPTYGRVSRYGMIAFASSLDQGGILSKTAADCALMLNAMAGFDLKDSTSANMPVPDYTATLTQPLKGLKIGIPQEFFAEGLDASVAKVVEQAIQHYQSLGATLHNITLPHNSLALSAYYIIAPAEASSNLSRYDGVRFGHRCDNPKNLEDLYQRSRAEGFGNEVKRRIMIGTYVLSSGYYDAYYRKAQQIRRLIHQDYQQAFAQVDVIMSPTSPTTAFELGAKTQDPVSMYLADIYTLGVNLAGLPAMSIPAGFAEGLPVGLQLIGTAFSEAKLLNIAHQFQQSTDWHLQLPKREI